MTQTCNMLFAAIDGRPNTKGGAYRLEMPPTTCHVYFGEVCLASADGRGEGQPVAGYSDYFCNRSEALQDEILHRAELPQF